jgi:hypothetical protein
MHACVQKKGGRGERGSKRIDALRQVLTSKQRERERERGRERERERERAYRDRSETLTTLVLNENILDDEKIRRLVLLSLPEQSR